MKGIQVTNPGRYKTHADKRHRSRKTRVQATGNKWAMQNFNTLNGR